MTQNEGPRAETGDTWPPTIENPVGPALATAPDTKQRELRRGRFALLSALTGIGLIVLATGVGLAALQTGWVQAAPLIKSNYLLLALLAIYLVGLICEVVAVIAGGISRRTWTGRWSLAISLLTLTAFFLYAPPLIRQGDDAGAWPWHRHSDDDCCHEKMR